MLLVEAIKEKYARAFLKTPDDNSSSG